MVNWTINPLFAVGLGLAVMFFGYFFGLFEGRGRGYKKRKEEEAEGQDHEALQNQELLPPSTLTTPSDEIPVLGVSLDTAGQLQLKLDGTQVDSSKLTADQRKRLITIITQMRPWLGLSKTSAPPAQPKPASSPQGASVSEPKPSPVQSPATAPEPTTPPLGDDEDELPPASLSIVAQIDSILQARLAGTPLADKDIRLQESLEGGAIVWVGSQKYESAEDVPDESIRAAIKGAITAWENRYTPGL